MSLSSAQPIVSDTTGRTNTIAVTALPKAYFDHVILDLLRDHFNTYGEINQWVPLAGFGRIIIVYNEEDNAELAKQQCDPIVLDGTADRPQVTLRVYRADPNPLISDDSAQIDHLRPPALDKNFLISPPGSPPVGWEQTKEDPPNSTPLAEDLITALRKLQLQHHGSGREILLDPDEGSGVSVFVEDFDGDDEDYEIPEEDWIYGESAPARNKWVPTSLPPMRSTAIVV